MIPKKFYSLAWVRQKGINLGIKHDIFGFNVESLEELKVLEQLSKTSGKKTRFALRINPNVDAGTHEYITTVSAIINLELL